MNFVNASKCCSKFFKVVDKELDKGMSEDELLYAALVFLGGLIHEMHIQLDTKTPVQTVLKPILDSYAFCDMGDSTGATH